MSFENPRAPLRPAAGHARPEIQIRVDVRTAEIGDGRYEVVIDINVDAKAGDAPVFLVELSYGGLFELANIPPDSLQPLLQIECPRLLFPFARRVVADATRDGGFPPLMIDPIDFVALFRRKLQAGARASPGLSASQAPALAAQRRFQALHDGRGTSGTSSCSRAAAGVGEAGGDELLEQRLAAAPVAAEVEQQHRLGVVAELAQGHDVEDLVERAEPARQCDERVGFARSELLALEHGGGDAQLGQVALADLAVEQPLRDDAQDRAAGRQGGAGGDAHQADLAAAIDQAPAAAPDRRRRWRPQPPRGLDRGRSASRRTRRR